MGRVDMRPHSGAMFALELDLTHRSWMGLELSTGLKRGSAGRLSKRELLHLANRPI